MRKVSCAAKKNDVRGHKVDARVLSIESGVQSTLVLHHFSHVMGNLFCPTLDPRAIDHLFFKFFCTLTHSTVATLLQSSEANGQVQIAKCQHISWTGTTAVSNSATIPCQKTLSSSSARIVQNTSSSKRSLRGAKYKTTAIGKVVA